MDIDLGKTRAYFDWFKQILFLDWKAQNAKSKNIRVVFRGQVYYCDLGLGIGSEETKNRPCVIIQNDTGNQYSPNTIVAPITNEPAEKAVSVTISGGYDYTDLEGKPQKLSGNILLGNIVTVSKARLGDKLVTLNQEISEINEKILTSVGIYSIYKDLDDKSKKDKLFIEKLKDENQKLKEEIKNLKK